MLKEQLQDIGAFIKLHNPWFGGYYTDVLQTYKGIVGNDDKPVFPADNEGEYFYLRPAEKVQFISNPLAKVSECKIPVAISASIFLVAVMHEADPDTLVGNLVNTLQAYGKDLVLREAILDPDYVIAQELSKIPEKDQEAAMQRVGNSTIVCINFILTFPLIPQNLNCLQNPCEC